MARTFRNRAGNYLLVLTSDYERLDFVLIDKELPTTKGPSKGIAQKQVVVRPRMLTVERRKPDRVHLRVLRRFTYTEADPIAQYEKLRSAYGIAEWSEEFFNNRALFSDYYLLERLRERDIWAEDPKPTYMALRNLYREAPARFAGEPEARVRSDLLEPVFDALGFSFSRGKKAKSASTEPDYRLASAETQDGTLAVCLAYPWGRSLDGKDEQRDKETPDENPNFVVVSLLERGEARWAVVTNGKAWRLYSARAHAKATNYYEVDLEEVLALGGPHAGSPAEAFRYFWLLFRREAFEPTTVVREGKEQTLCFLDLLLAESEDYAKELGERLKVRVFVEIFPHVADGFTAYMRQNEGAGADLAQERRDAIFQGTLTLLYRLLFLLYAESRDLLPVRETRGYYEISLSKLKAEIAEAAGTIADEVGGKLKRHYRDDSYDLYDRLMRLFGAVDQGDASVNVPFYNGGLFITQPGDDDQTPEAANARFLNAHKVPDRYLARAIDLLARDPDPKRQDLVFLDYKSLGVRHLGSIYEGLLEFKVRIADRKLGVKKQKGREAYVPFRELTDRQKARAEREGKVVRKGRVYLENDKRERKATGSYYTPDYIVDYIVEHTVGPVLEEKFEKVRPLLREAQQKRQAFFKQQEALRKKGLPTKNEAQADLKGREQVIRNLFDVKILDPAMGSGHFLVEAVDLITDRVLDFLNAFPWNPVRTYLEDTREAILEDVERQGVSIDRAKLTDVNLLKRYILKRCIYGVDLNPMAVELAKVSLWLDCFTLGAPLSFLDHHIRCGNSLIGVTVDEVRQALEKDTLWGTRFAALMSATNLMRHVGELSDVTSAQVQESRREYCQASDALAPFKRILDVYTSRWFGNEPQKPRRRGGRVTDPALEFLASPEGEAWASNPMSRKGFNEWDERVVERTLPATKEMRFFHWELEFPEVYYGPSEASAQKVQRLPGAGFDAVVGNPPYVQERRGNRVLFEDLRGSPTMAPYCEKAMDVFNLFLILGLQATKPRGRFGMIVPIYWTDRDGASLTRKALEEADRVRLVVDFAEYPVFGEASGHHSSILIMGAPASEPEVYRLPRDLYRGPKRAVEAWLRSSKPSVRGGFCSGVFVAGHGAGLDLFQKLLNVAGQHVQGRKNLSIGMNLYPDRIDDRGVFVLSDCELQELGLNEHEQALFLPFYYPQEAQRYRPLPLGPSFYVLYAEKPDRQQMATHPRRFAKLLAHLRSYESQMTSAHKPYGPHRTRKRCYFEGGYRVLGRRKVSEPRFTLTQQTACVDENFCICRFDAGPEAAATLGILNSKVAHYLFQRLKRHGDQLQIDVGVLEKIPLPIEKALSTSLPKLVRGIMATASEDERSALESQIDAAVYEVFGLNNEEIVEVESSF